MWSGHTLEYYSAWKRKNILTPATTWMGLEDPVLNDISQMPKDKYCLIPLRGLPGGVKFLGSESRWEWGLPGAWGREK